MENMMEAFSALLAFCVGNSPVTDEFPSQKPVTWSFEFSLICAWTYSWANNGDTGDLRRHRTHYHVTVLEGARAKWGESFVSLEMQNISKSSRVSI